MAGEAASQNKKTQGNVPSVRQEQIPKLRKVLGSGELGNVLCETVAAEAAKRETGLASVKDQLQKEISDLSEDTQREFRAIRTEAAAAKGAAKQSREKAAEAINIAAESVAMATTGRKKAEEALAAVQNAATKDELGSLDSSLKKTADSLGSVRTELDAIAEALSREVDSTDAQGNKTKKQVKGRELVNHLYGLVQTLRDSIEGFGEQIGENRKLVEQAAATAEQAFDTAEFNKGLLDTARQLVEDANDARLDDNKEIGERLVAVEKASENGGGNGVKKAAEEARTVAKEAKSAIEKLETSLREFAENVEGKILLVAQLALGESYEGEIQKELERPSYERR